MIKICTILASNAEDDDILRATQYRYKVSMGILGYMLVQLSSINFPTNRYQLNATINRDYFILFFASVT